MTYFLWQLEASPRGLSSNVFKPDYLAIEDEAPRITAFTLVVSGINTTTVNNLYSGCFSRPTLGKVPRGTSGADCATPQCQWKLPKVPWVEVPPLDTNTEVVGKVQARESSGPQPIHPSSTTFDPTSRAILSPLQRPQ